MLTLMTLFMFAFVAMAVVAVVGFAAVLLKCALKLVLLPLKLLFLPIIAIVLIVKFAVILAIGAVIIAILLPIAILALIFVGPFLLVSALT